MSTARSRRSPALQQLPSGRHGLPRAFVMSNQRERILAGVMQVVSEQGYVAMRVEDVIAVAGVSRRTFYDHFANKEEAYLAAYDLVVAQVTEVVRTAYASGDTFVERVSKGLSAFVTLLSQEPALANVCIVEVLTAGPRALSRRSAAMRLFDAFLQPGFDAAPKGMLIPPLTMETVVGGVYEVIYSRVIRKQTDELPVILPSLIHSVLLPFVGPEAAAAEYRAATRRVAQRAIATAG